MTVSIFVGNSLVVMPSSRLVSMLIDFDGKVSSRFENCTFATSANSGTVTFVLLESINILPFFSINVDLKYSGKRAKQGRHVL